MDKYAEIKCTYGTLRGFIHIPKQIIFRNAVLILHGYLSSNKIGPARLYVQLSQILKNAGYIVARFDCYGVGDSDGDFSEVTIQTEIRDYLNIIQFLDVNYNIDRVILLGHSMGANLSIWVSEVAFQKIAGLLILSPIIRKVVGIDNLFNTDQLLQLEKTGMTMRKGFQVSNSFVRNLKNITDTYKIASCLKQIPAMIIMGKKDEFLIENDLIEFGKTLHAPIHWIEHGDHNYFDSHSRELLFCTVLHSIDFLNSVKSYRKKIHRL